MKKTLYYRLILLCVTAVLLALSYTAPCKVYAKDAGAKKEGAVIRIGNHKKTVETFKGSFVKKKGNHYFKNQKGKLIKSRFFAKGGNIYYSDSKGVISFGWRRIKGHYYFFDRKSGKMIYNGKADNINITKEGKDLRIAFDPKFIIDVLRVIDEEEINLYLFNAKAPCFIRDDQSYIYLILPVNLIEN